MPTSHATLVPHRQAPEPLSRGDYLTDGHRLFRIVSKFTTTVSPTAELEDCRTLEVTRHCAHELSGMGLRVLPRTLLRSPS